MSDVTGTGTSQPQPSTAVGAVTSATSSGKRQDQEPPRENKQQSAEQAPQQEPRRIATPAVSVAASIAGLKAGQRVEGEIVGVDADGRPILETERGRFAIDPTAGLETGMKASFTITDTGRLIQGQVTARNGLPLDPPIAVTLTLVQARGGLLSGPASGGAPFPSATEQAAPTATPALPDFGLPYHLSKTAPPKPLPFAEFGAPEDILPLVMNSLQLGQTSGIPLSATHRQPQISAAQLTALLERPYAPVSVLTFEGDAPPVQEAGTSGPAVAAAGQSLQGDLNTALPIGTPMTAILKAAPGLNAGLAPSPLMSEGKPQSIQVAIVALTEPDALSPIAVPPKGTPLAALAQNGRVVTFSVIGQRPAPAAPQSAPSPNTAAEAAPTHLLLRHGDIELELPAPAAAPLGTKLTLAMIDRPLPARPAASGDAHAAAFTDKAAAEAAATTSSRPLLDTPRTETAKTAVSEHSQRITPPPFAPVSATEPAVGTPPPSQSANSTPPVVKGISPPATAQGARATEAAGARPADPKEANKASPATASPPIAASQLAMAMTQPPPLPRLQPQPWAPLKAMADIAIQQQAAAAAAAAAEIGNLSSVLDRIPQPGEKLTNTTLFFWRALGLGSTDQWLGAENREQAQLMGLGRLWASIQRDLAVLSEVSRGSPAGREWRAHPLPLHFDTGLQLINWFVRPHEPEWHGGGEAGGQNDPGNPAKEFMLDIEFEGFGRLRFSGVTRGKSLDLCINSLHALPAELRDSTQRIFASALEAGGLTGSLQFETGLRGVDLPSASVF